MALVFAAPTLNKTIGGYTFIISAIVSLFGGVFFLFGLKETKGLTEREIANLYRDTTV
jgi:hypothetical protein